MRHFRSLFLSALTGLALYSAAHAQSPIGARVVTSCSNTNMYASSLGGFQPPTMDINGVWCSTAGSGGGGGGGAVYGPNAEGIAPSQPPIFAAGKDKSGLVRAFGLDARGALISPNAAATDISVTKCSIAATSATATCNTYSGASDSSPTAGAAVCPATSNLSSTEISTATAPLALGLRGQTLTTTTPGNGAGTPDLRIPVADQLYPMPVSQTNAITGYNSTAAAIITTCIQKVRQ